MSDRLMNGEKLERGQSLTSRNGAYTLTLQDDGNLVLAAAARPCGRPAPTARTSNALRCKRTATACSTHPDKPVWHTDTKGAKDVRLLLQDDRNLVLYGFDGPAWASNTQTDEQPPAPAAEAPAPEVVPAAAEEPAPAPEPEPAPATAASAARSADIHGGLRRHPVGDRGTLLR